MKTKLKDILLYSLAVIGILSLFISASENQEKSTSFEMIATGNEWGDAYLYSPNDGTVYRVRGTNKKLVVE